MDIKELRRRGFARMDKERSYLSRLECEALEDMDEKSREWNHFCIERTRERIHGMMIIMYTLGAYDWNQKGE